MAEQNHIAHCKKAELYTHDGQSIVEARVITTASSPQIVLPHDVFADLDQPQCQVVFFDERGLIECKCCLVQPHPVNDRERRWQCQILHAGEVNNRRHDIKVATDLKVSISAETRTAQNRRPTSRNAKLVNVSTGGAYVSSFMLFHKGDSLNLYLPIMDEQDLAVAATVVRPADDLEPEGGCRMYGHGCQFRGLSMEDESVLRRFVFNEQIKNRHKT